MHLDVPLQILRSDDSKLCRSLNMIILDSIKMLLYETGPVESISDVQITLKLILVWYFAGSTLRFLRLSFENDGLF